VYIWCAHVDDVYRPVYVGQSRYLAGRFRQEIIDQLSGVSVILKSEDLETQGEVNKIYIPSDAEWIVQYLKNFSNLSAEAYRNLTLYSIFFALVDPVNIDKLRLIESAILNALWNHNITLLNLGSSKRADAQNPIRVISHFENKNIVVGMEQEISY